MSKKSKIVFIVEDSPVTQRLMTKMLENQGYQVINCFTAKECVTSLKEHSPDAILMDVIMPDCSGKMLVQNLMQDERNRKIPIIFTTNTLNVSDDKGHESFTIDDRQYRAFAKPLHREKFISALKKEINRAQSGGHLPKKVLGEEC